LTVLFGAPGTALGACVGEFVILALMMRSASMSVIVPALSAFLYPMLAGGCMGITALLLREHSVLVSLPVSVVVYGAAAVLFRSLRADEMHYLRERFV
jgi:hypothetical protein